MSKKEKTTSLPVHRVDLSLPVVQTDSYEIFYTIPSQQNLRTISSRKPLVDNNKKSTDQTAKFRSSSRLKHLIGPVFVNVLVDTNTMTAESISAIPDTVSNPLINSSYSNRALKTLPTINKNSKQKNIKDDGERSRTSSGDRLLYESFGSFDYFNINKVKSNNMWQNLHHPQLTSTKALHLRTSSKHKLTSNEIQLKVSNATSLDNLSQESTASANGNVYEQVEQLTKNYFPMIQQIRHSCQCPEVINNRTHFHREQSRDFRPILSRTRVVR
ncbi:unnamed protein product [Rotaria sp. Silwood1]|nr:unnamed protein product [Rotaria sp. Silwood1]CAF1380490.1 unnamed protein product [Rotaria sp. Silwood1]CAF3608497.1 unnamed protein product [Rotaria sp. Silwood1]CAF4625977.1 unnamed protein product [Rotaria sp. Silwood1]